MPAQDRTVALISAAMRHVRDAESLLDSSPDQSWHLAGFGPECARKACLEQRWLDRALGHDLTAVSDAVLDVALALDAQVLTYELRGLNARYTKLQQWRVEARYERTGTRDKGRAQELVEQAAALTYAIAAELWIDRRIPGAV